LSLGLHRNQQNRTWQRRPLLIGRRERVTARIRDGQNRTVLEAGHGAGFDQARRSIERYARGLRVPGKVQTLGSPVVEVQPGAGYRQDFRQYLGNLVEDLRSGPRAEDRFSELVNGAQPLLLVARSDLAAPPEKAQCGQ